MVRKLGGPDDTFIAFRTGHYKLHYYETPTQLKMVMVTDTKTNALRVVMHQIWVGLWVEYGMCFFWFLLVFFFGFWLREEGEMERSKGEGEGGKGGGMGFYG